MRLALAALLSVPLAAWPQAGPSLSPQNGSPADVRQFLERVAQFHMTQAHLGALAEQRASAQQVKDYGKELANSHKDAYNQLSALAATTSLTVPKAIDAQHQTTVQRFEKLSGRRFDDAFRDQEIKTHQDALNWLQQMAQSNPNPQVKEYASRMVSEVQNHLNAARALGQQSGGTGSASRAADDAKSAVAGSGVREQHSGTVMKYDPGKLLEVKVRDRIGLHRYDLAGVSATVPADLKVGDTVSISESVDQNGARSLSVQRSSANAAGQDSGRANRSDQRQTDSSSGTKNKGGAQ